MSTPSLVNYDQVPYFSSAFKQTHPCHLAVLPSLFGSSPPRVRGGRVLELGCASGGNLIPMAQDLPESEFIGVDLSARQIADGHSLLAQVKLDNVELRHQSILDVDDSWGKFNFIICHGVYSWVPRNVQDKILEIGSRNLNAGGLCYVSYNTFPGWHMRAVVRDMMQYHVARYDDPQTKIAQARCLLEFLNKSCTPHSETYRHLLADEAAILEQHSDSYLFHEHLEDVNEPLYFHQFVERAQTAGLKYLGETDFRMMLAESFDPATAAILQDAPLLQQEQYMDFLRNRTFRGTVLCQADAFIDPMIPATRLATCHLMLDQPVSLNEASFQSHEPLAAMIGQHELTVSHPATKAALAILSDAWPCWLPFEDLLSQATAKIGAMCSESPAAHLAGEPLRSTLAHDLMTLFTRRLLHARVDPPSLVRRPGPMPCVTPLVRTQARLGKLVVNRLHETVQVDDVTRSLLAKLDGEHTRESLLSWLSRAFDRGEFSVHRGENLLSKIDNATLNEVLDGALQSIAQHALLIR